MVKSFLLFILLLCSSTLVAQHARLSPALDEGVETPKNVRVLVDDSIQFTTWIKQINPQARLKRNAQGIFLVENIASDLLIKLKSAPGVRFIDRGNRKATEEKILGDFDFNVNSIPAAHTTYPSINGESLVVSIKEKPFEVDDLDLRGRIILNDQFDESPTFHASFMATIAAGAGNTSQFARGAAWAALMTTSDFDELMPDDGAELTEQQVSVQNHSYGVGIENYYGIESSAYDAMTTQYPKLLHVFSSGNSGTGTTQQGLYATIPGVANLTGQFKTAKNVLTVGSADLFENIIGISSRGPAHDGRIKPEVIAFGDAGSSEAAAVASGIALLVQDAYTDMHNELPDAALVKAILINSAHDVGRPEVDFESGFGNLDALQALRTVQGGNYYSGTLTQNETVTIPLVITANQYLTKVTLTWADPAAAPGAEKALRHDLDLKVRKADHSEEWLPWILDPTPSLIALQQPAQRGVDRLNNIEQVTITLPEAGDYEIVVSGFQIEGDQQFHIAYETYAGFEWRFPTETSNLRSNTPSILRWNWFGIETIAELSYRFASEDHWHDIGDVILTDRDINFTIPDTSALIQFRMTIHGEYFDSPVVPVSKPGRIDVGFNCSEEVMLQWGSALNAEEYILYSVKEKYLEPFIVTTDTFAVFPKEADRHFAVVPVFNGKIGSRDLTIDYTTLGTGCYTKSFVAQQYLVNEVASFDLSIGTTYNLESVTLQRMINNEFVSIASPIAPNATSITLTDNPTTSGVNRYRVELLTSTNQVIYSEEAEIFAINENEIFIFPNPAIKGDDLNIITEDEEITTIEIIDLHGRKLGSATDSGPVKLINTVSFPAGTYILRIQQQSGKINMRRVVIR